MMKMPMRFKNPQGDRAAQVVIVTGGSRGIGLATARAFIEQGARVGICGFDPERLLEAHKALEGLGEVETVVADVRFIGQIQAFVDRVIDRFETADVLVNNAGRASVGRFAEEEPGSIDSVGGAKRTRLPCGVMPDTPRAVARCVLPVPVPPIKTTLWAASVNDRSVSWLMRP